VTFDEAFERLIGHEGGFQNNPEDRGNWTSGKIGVGELRGTKYGISAMTYPTLDIAALTLDDARRIYRRDFWGAAGCELVQGRLRFDLFDTAVHSGPGMAARLLQRALGVTADGIIGPKTMLTISHMDPGRLAARFNGHRLDFLNNNPQQWAEFGRGWAQRIAENLMED
jgi:lysozyme family protein